MDWFEYVMSQRQASDSRSSFQRNPPATEADLIALESDLGSHVPPELRELLLQSNGIDYADPKALFIWGVEEIRETNLDLRRPEIQSLFMPFSCLFFFAGSGNGDYFGFSLPQDPDANSEIFLWDHEDDSRRWSAPDLKKFIEWNLEGKC